MECRPLGKLLAVLMSLILIFGALPGSQPGAQAATTGLPGTGMACFRSLDAIKARLTDLVNDHPTLAEIVDIGESWEKTDGVDSTPGSDLLVLHLTNREIIETKPVMFVVSGLDSRDILGIELNLRFAERLLRDYGKDPNVTMVLDTSEVQLLIVSNPDGRQKLESQFAETPDTLPTYLNAWGRNRNSVKCPSSDNTGVDLSRNFALDFMPNPDCGDDYPGPSAESEPETQAIVNRINTLFSDLRITPDSVVNEKTPGLVINLIEWDDVPRVIYPYHSGYRTDPLETKNWIYLLAEKLANVPGTLDFFKAQLANTNDSTRYGNLIDYAYGELGVPALEYRLKKSIYPTKFPTCSEFEGNVANIWLEALLVASRAVARPFEFGQGPEFTPQLYVTLPTQPFSQLWTISGTANSHYYQEVPVDLLPSDPENVVTSKNAPPWHPDALETGPVALFNPTVPYQRQFISLVSFDGIAGVSKQLVYLQAVNADGQFGFPRAVFLTRTHYLALPVVSLSK